MPPAWGRRPGHLYPALLSQGTPLHFIMLFITVCSYAASSLADCLSSLAEWKLHERGGNAFPMTTTSSAVHLAQEAFEELTNDNYFGLLILQKSRKWFRAYHWIFNPSQPLLSSRRTVFPPDLTRPLGWQSKSLRVSRVSRLSSVLDSTAPHLHLRPRPAGSATHGLPPPRLPLLHVSLARARPLHTSPRPAGSVLKTSARSSGAPRSLSVESRPKPFTARALPAAGA